MMHIIGKNIFMVICSCLDETRSMSPLGIVLHTSVKGNVDEISVILSKIIILNMPTVVWSHVTIRLNEFQLPTAKQLYQISHSLLF